MLQVQDVCVLEVTISPILTSGLCVGFGPVFYVGTGQLGTDIT